jgi:copper(I)-binding protein
MGATQLKRQWIENPTACRDVMLMGIHDVLKAGDTVSFALTFANAGTIQVTVKVREQ